MENDKKMKHDDYEYEIVSHKKANGMYQGMILLTAHAGMPYSPIVEIPTPSTFRTERAARIEASALACQLIETGAMVVLVPPDDASSCCPKPAQTTF